MADRQTANPSGPDTKPAILCRHLWKIFGPHPTQILQAITAGDDLPSAHAGHVVAVRDVSFEVTRGETFVVMGLSGSGKSTLIRCLLRLAEPTSGELFVAGRDLLALSETELRDVRRRKISMVFQSFGLLPHRRVLENVAFGLEVRGEPLREREARARAMIELVGLGGWERHYPRQLSGGMQQRVGLARALAGDPEIMLYDEPFSALDPLIRREMQDELLRLQATLHKTSVFITHDFAEALRLGDRIAIMRDGRVVQTGSPEDLTLAPADDYVAAFVRDAPRAKVLSVRRIMRPLPADAHLAEGPRLRARDRVETALPIVAATDGLIGVCDEDGALCGCLDRGDVMRTLAGA
ncbi:MAG: betaine/proline/choline family ABC transporter ATP-binding protein [Anaerolineales bacterium]|nr:betaine/proline/choline family ABC transporter ATP-binding protein [Anaerolineales bacterium]